MSTDESRNKRRRRWLILLLLLPVLFAARKLPLLALGGFLASGRPVQGDFDYVLLGGGDGELEMAARLIEGKPNRKIVLAESEPTRLVAFGVLRPDHEVDMARLKELGVPRDRIVLIPQDPAKARWGSDLFAEWHREQQLPKTLILREELGQRAAWMSLRRYCTKKQLEQLYSLGLVNRNYPVDRWWQSRRGIKAVVLGYVSLGISMMLGPEEPLPHDQRWSPDEYEQSLERLR